MSPAPWRPCFLTNPNGLNNLGRGSPKEKFLQNYIEIGPVVSDKKIFKVFYIQSTLVISNSKGLSEILRDIRSSTYQVCRIEEKII